MASNKPQKGAGATVPEALPPGRVVAAFLLPPLAVFLATGISPSFWLAVLLTCLGYLPGIVFAFFILLTKRRVTGDARV